MKIFLDGQIIDAEQAVISPFDHGFLYGLGLFETMRVYNGHVALLERHYRRLSEAAEEIGIAVTMTREELRFAILQTLNANQLKDAYIRVDLTAGNEALGPFAGIYENPRWLIFARPLPDFPEHFYQIGKKLQTLKRPRNTPEGTWRFKSHHYMNNRLAKREVGASPDVEGLFLTEDGCLAEGIVSNVFFITEGKLCTPDVKTGILPGTRREFVMELAQMEGMEVREGWFHLEHLLTADEVFITNAIQEIVPIHSVDSKIIQEGTIGPMTSELLASYRKNIV